MRIRDFFDSKGFDADDPAGELQPSSHSIQEACELLIKYMTLHAPEEVTDIEAVEEFAPVGDNDYMIRLTWNDGNKTNIYWEETYGCYKETTANRSRYPQWVLQAIQDADEEFYPDLRRKHF